MKRSEFHFDLPPDLIAQHPAPDRDGARLLVVDAQSGTWSHRAIRDLPELIPAGSLCVPNDVRVRHARIFLRRRGGGSGEALLLRSLGAGVFEAMLRPGARLKPGASATVIDPVSLAELARIDVLGTLPEGLRTVRVHAEHDLDWDEIDRIGRLPLPPYIEHLADDEDETRYQTVFAAREGEAVAAPTAGLHFTPEVLAAIEARGVEIARLTLHVGLGTFAPLRVEKLSEIRLHSERYTLSDEAAAALNDARAEGRRIVAVGTTAVRTLEHCAHVAAGRPLTGHSGETEIFLSPGHRFQLVDAMLTNFHLPQSSLLMLVSAFAGREEVLAAYRHAVAERYRFFSYGDCMFLS